MIGIIDVGGGLRGAYGAGVLDYCLDNHIDFDYCLGVSAGIGNLVSYAAGQRGRNYRFYMDYTFRPEYMGISNFVKNGSYLDLEYIYGTLTNENGEDPLDYDALQKSGKVLKSVALNALTGKPVYFDSRKDMPRNDYYIAKASSCMPLYCKPWMHDGVPYYDGGVVDPIPLNKAFEDGCEKVALILTKPLNMKRNPAKDIMPSKFLSIHYPKAAETIHDRANKYNEGIRLAKEYASCGKVKIIAPDDIGEMKTLTKDVEILKNLYFKGYRDAQPLRDFLKGDQYEL